MSQYSHNPWVVKQDAIKYHVPAKGSAWEYWQSVPKSHANLQLMSAAPELYEALLALVQDTSDIPSKYLWDQACAAIKKAEMPENG